MAAATCPIAIKVVGECIASDAFNLANWGARTFEDCSACLLCLPIPFVVEFLVHGSTGFPWQRCGSPLRYTRRGSDNAAWSLKPLRHPRPICRHTPMSLMILSPPFSNLRVLFFDIERVPSLFLIRTDKNDHCPNECYKNEK